MENLSKAIVVLIRKCLKENYKGIIEIYPTKCTNTRVLNKVLFELSKTHNLVKITKGWIRAFEK